MTFWKRLFGSPSDASANSTKVSPGTANVLDNSLIDPRLIRRLIVISSDDEPGFGGVATPEELAYAVWGASNRLLYQVLAEMQVSPDVEVRCASRTVGPALQQFAAQTAVELIRRSIFTASVAVQSKEITLPNGATGARHVYLLTVFDTLAGNQPTVLTLDVELLPKYYPDGRPTIEIDK